MAGDVIEIKDLGVLKSTLDGTDVVPIQDANGVTQHTNVDGIVQRVLTVSVGWADYSNSAAEQSYVGGSGNMQLLNDGSGPYTNVANLPEGVTTLWDSVTNEFDFSELSVGDLVDIRVDIEITTQANNQEVEVFMELAIGTVPYQLGVALTSKKAVGVIKGPYYTSFYIGDTNTLNSPARLYMNSDDDTSVKVNGWYCKVHKL